MIQVLAREFGPANTRVGTHNQHRPQGVIRVSPYRDLDPRAEWPFGADGVTEMRVERVIGPTIGLRQVFDLE